MRQNVLTGVFVIIASAVLIAIAYFAGKKSFAGEGVAFYADFEDVALLEEQSPVTVAGMSVGKVTEIREMWDGGTVVIRVVFDVDDETASHLLAGTFAEIEAKSFLGGKYMKLMPGPGPGPLPEDSDGRRITGIKPVDLMDEAGRIVKEVLPEIADKVNSLLVKLDQQVLSEENIQKILSVVDQTNKLIGDADNLVNNVDQNLNGAEGTIVKIDVLVEETNQLVSEIRGQVPGLQALLEKGGSTLDTANSTLEGIDRTVREDVQPAVNSMATRIDEILGKVEARVDPVLAKVEQVLGSADRVLNNPDLYATLNEARNALREFKLLARTLRADPSQVLFGGVGEAGLLPADMKSNELELRRGGRGRRYDY